MKVLLLILSWCYFNCLKVYSDKFFNSYFYEKMFLKSLSQRDANFAAEGAGGDCKPPIIQSALLDYSVSFLIVVCYILVCKG